MNVTSPIRPRLRALIATACLSWFSLTAATAGDHAPIVYDDLDAFAGAITAIDAGTAPEQAMADYLAASSPGAQIFVQRFGLTAESLAAKYARYPKFYRHVAGMRPALEAREPELRAALDQLQSNAPPGVRQVPLYFLVGNLTAGGNPGLVPTENGMRPAIGVAVEMMAMSAEVDMSEFPNGPVGLERSDIPYVAVHEMSHVFQMQLQGLDNYRSIYTDPARGSNLAFALREGCADFLTWRASGWSFAERRAYVQANEAALWAEFSQVMHRPQDSGSGWFGPRAASRPEWPMQVGYGVGMAICEDYYQSIDDKAVAIDRIHRAHLPEHFEAIAAPYAARMAAAQAQRSTASR